MHSNINTLMKSKTFAQQMESCLAETLKNLLSEELPVPQVKKPEPLNAWGQDAKTAKAERKRLRQERASRAYMKAQQKANRMR